jgi:IS5 family transposase
LRPRDLKRVTVDTTVQPKAVTFPTDAKLLHAAMEGLNRLVRRHGLKLRRSWAIALMRCRSPASSTRLV